MARVSAARRGFVPFATTVNAMNRVSRSLQEERRRAKHGVTMRSGDYSSPQGLNLPSANFDTLQNLVASELDQFDPATITALPDFPMNVDGDFHPLGFVRALENDFQSRSWHDTWWDFNGGPSEGMSGLDEK